MPKLHLLRAIPKRILIFLSFLTCGSASSKYTGSCSDRSITFARRAHISLSPDYEPAAEVIQVHESPPSECFKKCFSDPQCYGYVRHYRNSSCVLIFKAHIKEQFLVSSNDSSYHWKICLPGQENVSKSVECPEHEWAFDVAQGVQLSRYDDKQISFISSVEDCMSLCFAEATFPCRSSSYKPRQQECVLSRHDRRTAAEVFRTNVKQDEPIFYLERQCVVEPTDCHFRFRGTPYSLSFQRQYVQVMDDVQTREKCEDICLRQSPFPCRSYQFTPDAKGSPVCLVSPEDSNSIDVVPQVHNEDETHNNSGVFEKESCIESEVRCGSIAMSVVIRVSTPFRGRLYALGYPYDCYSVKITSDGRVTLDLPLHGRRCGTRNLGNGTFVNSVVVQHHPFVLRTSDRRIEVACDYQELSKVKIKSTKGIRQSDANEEDFRSLLHHTVTAIAPTPPIRLRVVNASDQDVVGAELGDALFLKVELADDSVYGIFGSDLVARSSAGSETVLLIDDNGCPVEPTVISSLEKLPGSKSLVAPFQAFKFASDSSVKFQLTVSYCLDACLPVECGATSSRKIQQRSFGKRRKRASSEMFTELLPGDVVLDVQAETTYLVINNLAPQNNLGRTDQTHHLIQPQYVPESSGGQIRMMTTSNAFCFDSSTIKLLAVLAGVFQLILLGVCFFLFCIGNKQCFRRLSFNKMGKLLREKT